MYSRRPVAAALLSALLFAAACAPEPTGPGAVRTPGEELFGAPSASPSDLEVFIRNGLNQLAGLTPPDATAYQALFTNLLNAIAGNPENVGEKLNALLQFIDNHAGDAADDSQVGQIRDAIIAALYALVNLDPDATICVLPPGHPSSVCVTPNPNGIDNAGFVYFPPSLFEALTFVSIKALDNTGVGSGLDEYGYALEIRTAPISTFGSVKPTVVACVPNGLPTATLNRLLIGHRRAADKYDDPPFSLLPDAGIETDQELLGYAEDFCGKPPEDASPSFFGLSAESRLGRVLARTADFLLPQRLLATNEILLNSRGFSGAAGSPEEFSTFRAVDRGVTGAGGSPEEFAPTTAGDPTGELLTGAAGTTATTGLPFVIVQTPAGGRGVNGVKVTFTVGAPTRKDADGNLLFTPASDAALCDGKTAVTVTTGGEENGAPVGIAVLPCLEFGTKAGYANIKATFDPTQVFADLDDSEQPCMIGGDGDCDPAVTRNFLAETVAGPAAQIAIVEGNNQSAPAYTAVPVAPKVIVKDQYGNVVFGESVTWSANVGTIDPNAGEGNEDTGTTTTDADGTSAVTSWTLGAGPNTLLAEIAVGEGTESVQFTAEGTFGLSLGNACVTGGQKDDITKFGFHFPYERNRTIQAIGLHLSSNGAPGQSENYEVTLTATRVLPQSGQTPARTDVRTATARLQSSSNSSKGIENLVIFDFNGDPFPVDSRNNGTVTVRMSVAMANGDPIPANRVVNMNAGSCPAGQLNCNQNQRRVAEARTCSQTESQLGPPLVENYRRAFAGRVYTSP